MAEICIPTDRVPADILHRLKAIGQLLQSETSCASHVVGQSLSSAVMREKDNNTCDEVDGGLEVDRSRIHVETRVRSGGKDKGDIVSALTRASPEKQVEQGVTSATQENICQDMFVLQQQQQPVQALHQLHQGQTNHRQHQTHCTNKLSPFSSHVDDGAIDDTMLDASCQRPRSPSQAEVGVQDILRQRRTMRSPFVPDSGASFTSGPPGMPAHRTASFGQTSARVDDDIVRVFPSTSVAAPADVGYQQSPKVLTPPETPENEGKRKVKDVFTFDDFACAEELFRQNMEKMSQLQEQMSQTSPIRRDGLSAVGSRHPSAHCARGGEAQGSLNTAPRSAPADLHLLQCADTPVRKRLNMDGMSCRGFSSSQSSSLEDYPVRQRRNSLSPQSQRTLSFEHGVGGLLAPRSPLFVHSLPRSYDSVGAPYPPASPRQASTSSAGEGDGSRADFPFYAYRHEGQQVVMGGAASTPTKQPFASDRTCFPERPILTSSTQLHGRVTTGYEEDEMAGPVPRYFLPTQFSYNSADHRELQARLTMQGDRNTPKRRRPDFDVMGEERDMAYCTCAVMEGNFLQMAECAYKRIRRLDSSPSDFERFRKELAQTNEILRESMGLMKNIREMCDHRPRSRP